MATTATKPSISEQIRSRITRGGERLWRHDDFRGFPSHAVAQTLSRLSRQGQLRRVSKGVYFRSRRTAFGESQPNPAELNEAIVGKVKLFPAGIIAANMLGLTTQVPKRREMATTASSISPTMLGPDVIIRTRRPQAWNQLSDKEGAILDVLRRRADCSEFGARETVQRLLKLLREERCLGRLIRAARTEPPRVRALLGALAEQIGHDAAALDALKKSLNPLSRFKFGLLGHLKYAKKWQAKECPDDATMSTS